MLYVSGHVVGATGVAIAPGRRLSVKPPGGERRKGFHLFLTDDRATLLWEFDLAALTGYVVCHSNYFSYRPAGNHVYVIASEEPRFKPHATNARCVVPHPTRFHLVTVELERGTVVQDILLNDRPLAGCRIEDVDERAVLVSVGTRELRYYRRLD